MTSLCDIIEHLRGTFFKDAFNPYANFCPYFDKPDSPQLRADLLRRLFSRTADRAIESIWLGRDLGYRGGRRTGLALTDDAHLAEHASRWGEKAQPATVGPTCTERTAGVIWKVLRQIDSHVVLWNVFPLHPHQPDRPLSNRPHVRPEREFGEEILTEMVRLLRPRRIIALGVDAEQSGRRIAGEIPVYRVRHPSHGGQNQFMATMRELYKLPEPEELRELR